MSRPRNASIIPNFVSKLRLIIIKGESKLKNIDSLRSYLELDETTFQRLINETRAVLSKEKLNKLSNFCKVNPQSWYSPLIDFGKDLGFSKIDILTNLNLAHIGLDFNCRISETSEVNNMFFLLSGYFELIHISMSMDNMIAKSILCVDGVNVRHVEQHYFDNIITCRIFEDPYDYKGVCFPVRNQLIFMFESDHVEGELVTIYTHKPGFKLTKSSILYGLALGLNINSIVPYPCACRVVLRYLGSKEEVLKQYSGDNDIEKENSMRKGLTEFVEIEKFNDPIYEKIVNKIDEDKVLCMPYHVKSNYFKF